MTEMKIYHILFLFLCTSFPLKAVWESRITKVLPEKTQTCFVDYKSAPVKLDRLRTVHITHWDFEGHEKKGSLVVLDVVAPAVETIFKELYEKKFPLKSCIPIDAYAASDEKSMEANNSSAFNSRLITGSTDRWSIHSYGLAIDINPRQNPYLAPKKETPSNVLLLPSNSFEFINRQHLRAGMVEPIVSVFKRHGFTVWGGTWEDRIDYHHFQLPTDLAHTLAELSHEEGQKTFEAHVQKTTS